MRRLSLVIPLVLTAMAARESEAQLMWVSGSPPALRIDAAVAGSTLAPASESSTTYTLFASSSNTKIVGRINSPMPAGVALTITLQAPSGSISEGEVTLSTTNKDLVTSIDRYTFSTRSITYELSATLSAGVVASQSRTVTLTVVSGA